MSGSTVARQDDGNPSIQEGPSGNTGPLSDTDLDRLSEALTMSSWETGLNFSVYIGDLGDNRSATLEQLHASFGGKATDTCLLAISPNQRAVEITVGVDAARRLSDRSCNLAILAMTTNFSGGDLIGGVANGLRMLSDQAGHQPSIQSS